MDVKPSDIGAGLQYTTMMVSVFSELCPLRSGLSGQTTVASKAPWSKGRYKGRLPLDYTILWSHLTQGSMKSGTCQKEENGGVVNCL